MSDRISEDEAALRQEIAAFQGVWKGGFYTGDPLDPTFSPHGLFGYVGVHHAVYLACIRQYVGPDTVALEIGPGRGAWTKALLGAKEVWCLDALSAEHNGFWSYLGGQPHVHYVQVADFSCAALPNDGINYVFSYDTLCHVSFSGIEAYMRNLYPKLQEGTRAFVMIADREKYRAFIENRASVADALVSQIGRPWLKKLVDATRRRIEDRQIARFEQHVALPEGPDGSWWYYAGIDRTCEMLERTGYTVVDPDVGCDPKNPIIHFTR